MILLRLISWPYFRRHVLRTLLTTAGIVLGVAVFVGMHTANQSVLFAFSKTVDRIAGKTELQVTAGEAGFSEEILDPVQSASTVRVAVPVIEAVVDSGVKGQGSLLILGVDMTGDRSLRDYDLENGDDAVIDDPLVFLAQPDSLIVAKEFADKARISVNQTIVLGTVEGERRFTVRGIMKPSGPHERVRREPGDHGRVRGAEDVRPRSNVRPDRPRCEAARTIPRPNSELRALLGPGFQVDPPSGRGQQFEAMLSAYSMMVNISSLFALFIGMFIIYNSFAIAVTSAAPKSAFCARSARRAGRSAGCSSARAPSPACSGRSEGWCSASLIARGIAASIGTLISDVYGVAQHADEVATNPSCCGSRSRSAS